MIGEILAPAGSGEALTAALRAGADAVYFGTGDFNARRNAANFDGEAFAAAVAQCHRQGAKAYITLNTLIKENELPRVLHTVELICRAGADAVIVQDLGLATLIRKAAPALALHASTQMSIHSPAALPLLQKLGFTRVVVARELSRTELEAICAAARDLSMEVEYFVHGALCMCVSGQCYLSAMLGGRSGSRGLCAQPCRLPFAAPDGTGHDLSLKDLSLIDHLHESGKLGVTSFKIEGRMKRPEYVAAAVAACRSMLDRGFVEPQLLDALSGVFSRSGFTDGYYMGKRGVELFGTRTEEDVKISREVLSGLHALYRTERQCVALNGQFTADASGAQLVLHDGTHTVSSRCDTALSDKTMDSSFLIGKLSKSGGTNYQIEKIDVTIAEHCYLSAAALGKLRGDCLAQLDRLRMQPVPLQFCLPNLPNSAAAPRQPRTLIARFDSIAQIPEALDGIAAVILPIEQDFTAAKLPQGVRKIVDIPRGIFGKEDYIAERLSLAKQSGFDAAMCGNLSAVALANAADIPVIADFGLNLFNSSAVSCAEQFGATAAVLSFELTIKEQRPIQSHLPLGAVVYGRLPLMLTRNCPVQNGTTCAVCNRSRALTDRKGVSFPVRCRLGCSELLNSRPLTMQDRLRELPVDFGVLYFTDESRAECAKVIDACRSGAPMDGEYTRGLYYRGVE